MVNIFITAGDFTLFAPIDTAFGVYRNTLLRPSNPNVSHIYAGKFYDILCEQLRHHENIPI